MAPELLTTMEANELREKALAVKDYQEAKGLSFSQLRKKFPDIGSDRTFGKILKGELADLDLENQLSKYRSVFALIESIGDDDDHEEQLYDDLWPVVQLRRVFIETMRESGNGRAIFLIGPSGSGKTCARKILLEKYGSRLLKIEASAAWNGSPMAFLGAILIAFGEQNLPMVLVERLNKVIDKLRESRRCLVVEEAHHLGRVNLNVEVTIINQTDGEIINIAIDTLWKKLESAAFEECRQLTGNRLAEVIRLGRDVRESDARKLLERRVNWANGDCKQALRLVLDKAANFGRLAFVRDVCKRVNTMADGEPVGIELFTSAVTEEVASR